MQTGLETCSRKSARQIAKLISNTNIAASTDLFDRMHETLMGPELRDWCQACGLLDPGQDFAGKRQRGEAITVRAARTFIVNYYRGKAVDPTKFDTTHTTPIRCKTGVPDPEWGNVKLLHHDLWKDKKLRKAGKEFARLVQAQRDAFTGKRANIDYAEKGLNFAVMSAWAYVSGMLSANDVRLERHYSLADAKGKDGRFHQEDDPAVAGEISGHAEETGQTMGHDGAGQHERGDHPPAAQPRGFLTASAGNKVVL